MDGSAAPTLFWKSFSSLPESARSSFRRLDTLFARGGMTLARKIDNLQLLSRGHTLYTLTPVPGFVGFEVCALLFKLWTGFGFWFDRVDAMQICMIQLLLVRHSVHV